MLTLIVAVLLVVPERRDLSHGTLDRPKRVALSPRTIRGRPISDKVSTGLSSLGSRGRDQRAAADGRNVLWRIAG